MPSVSGSLDSCLPCFWSSEPGFLLPVLFLSLFRFSGRITGTELFFIDHIYLSKASRASHPTTLTHCTNYPFSVYSPTSIYGTQLITSPIGTFIETGGIPQLWSPKEEGKKQNVLIEGVKKEVREFDGKRYLFEPALRGDVGILRAWKVDKAGNCVFRWVSALLLRAGSGCVKRR
jgi:hypothetical protein